jgi:hypothetical protein
VLFSRSETLKSERRLENETGTDTKLTFHFVCETSNFDRRPWDRKLDQNAC